MKKTYFKIGFVIPEGAPLYYVKDYIRNALKAWGGQRHPDDPLFDGLKVTITAIKEDKK